MTGRELLKKNKKSIDFLFKLINRLSQKKKKKIWEKYQNSNGKFALLMRYIILKTLCKKVEDNVYIGRDVEIIGFENLEIGENVSIHKNCYLDATGSIQIGNNVSIAHSSSIISFNHTWNEKSIPIKYNPSKLGKIIINDDVWIGANVKILADVEIKSRVVVAAGAVVTKSVNNNLLVGGIPAKEIKKI